MRALLTLVFAVILSGLIAGATQMELGVVFNAQEELIVAMVAEIVFTLIVAAILAVVIVARGGPREVNSAAIGVTIAAVLALAALEAFTLSGEAPSAWQRDVPLLTEIGIPALLTVLVQWWLVRRYVRRRLLPHTPAVVPTTG